jgi:hypothetical protein
VSAIDANSVQRCEMVARLWRTTSLIVGLQNTNHESSTHSSFGGFRIVEGDQCVRSVVTSAERQVIFRVGNVIKYVNILQPQGLVPWRMPHALSFDRVPGSSHDEMNHQPNIQDSNLLNTANVQGTDQAPLLEAAIITSPWPRVSVGRRDTSQYVCVTATFPSRTGTTCPLSYRGNYLRSTVH